MLFSKDYMDNLKEVQNRPENANRDIMSIVVFMDDEQKRLHILRYVSIGDKIYNRYI